MNIAALVLACAPYVHPTTARAIVAVESSFNPYAIGVVDGVLQRQPRTRARAAATAGALRVAGRNFSAGLAQINVRNWERTGVTIETVFDSCSNLRAMQRILRECYARAPIAGEQVRLRDALSCYYAGNFVGGYRDGYVDRVLAAAASRCAVSDAGSPALGSCTACRPQKRC
jgi:type IV secretion system protein VirB1